VDIDAVVAAAGRQAIESHTSARPTLARPMATLPPALAATQDAALAQMMASMEQAARRAMEGRRDTNTLPPLRPTARPATPERTAPAPATPAPSQPMAQPSGGPITHYRRRPGASQFDQREI
jgi:hypothetical protein